MLPEALAWLAGKHLSIVTSVYIITLARSVRIFTLIFV
jgi:membrane protein YqaA with SNARE-associated domain